MKDKNVEAMTVDPQVYGELQQQLRMQLRLWGTTHSTGERLMQQYSEEAQNLQELLTRTLTLGESNSALLLAPRGTGKSSLVEEVLGRLQDGGVLGQGLVVRLSGLLHTTDRLALRDITAQLNLEAATTNKVFNSFAENLTFLLESLHDGTKEASRPVIFLLDEFDLFCHHRNQTLLYNLFDVAQAAQAPICVLGLTCRLDVVELLEKRVKSRFSHRQIHLFPTSTFDPDYLDTCRLLLTLPPAFPFRDFREHWNKHVSRVVEEAGVRQVLQRTYHTSKDVRSLKALLLLCVSRLHSDQPQLSAHMFETAQTCLATEAKTNLLQGLSVLQLTLVVAMKHLTTLYEGDPFNFEMVMQQYLKFCRRRSSMQVLQRAVVLRALDQLLTLELVRGVEGSGRGAGLQREYQLVQLMMTPSQVDQALAQLPSLPTDLQQWASSSLG